jgi:NDP-sugar pyrophosphorylase family protein
VDYFGTHTEPDVRVQFVVQSERRGMANALSKAAEHVRGDFLLTACDNLVPANEIGQMLALWKARPQPNGILALMEVAPEKIKAVGIVELDGEWVTDIVEKPNPEQVSSNIASMPLYIFSKRILDYLPEVPLSPRGEYELQDAIQMLIERDGQVRGYHIPGRLTLTSPADLLALNRHYLVNGNTNQHDSPKTVGTNTKLIPPLHIEAGVVIGTGCEIGPNVYIERDCRIGDGVTIRESVLLRGVRVPDGMTVEEKVIS